jgi:hypothetical protein
VNVHRQRSDIASLHCRPFFLQSPGEVGLFLFDLANLALEKPYVSLKGDEPVV